MNVILDQFVANLCLYCLLKCQAVYSCLWMIFYSQVANLPYLNRLKVITSYVFSVKQLVWAHYPESGIINLMIIMYLGGKNRTGSSSLGVTICWVRNYFSGQLFKWLFQDLGEWPRQTQGLEQLWPAECWTAEQFKGVGWMPPGRFFTIETRLRDGWSYRSRMNIELC